MDVCFVQADDGFCGTLSLSHSFQFANLASYIRLIVYQGFVTLRKLTFGNVRMHKLQ